MQTPPGLDEGKVRCGSAQSSLRAMEKRLGVLEQVFVLVDWEEVEGASARLSYSKPGLEFDKIVEAPRRMEVENVVEKDMDMPMDEKVKTHVGAPMVVEIEKVVKPIAKVQEAAGVVENRRGSEGG